MLQLDLSFTGYARQSDPDTSRDAAFTVNATALEQTVLNAIQSFGESGCISDDVMRHLPYIPLVSISPRYRRLIEKGLIEDTGERRPGISGRSQRVMRAIYKS
jgi:hypothetical protein